MLSIKDKIVKAEPFLFYASCLLMLIPLFRFQFFPTTDGPSHVYNANLIGQKLFHSNPVLDQYFYFHHEPVPNWISHVIMGFFRLFFSASLSEKLFQILYVLCLPIGFRTLVKSFNGSLWFTWLAFPFIYNFLFIFGFYNFSFAIVLMLFTIRFWKRSAHHLGLKNTSLLFLLITLTYFSHVFVFALLGLFIILDLIFEFIRIRCDKNESFTTSLIKHLKKSAWVVVAALPAGTLFLYYYLSRESGYEKRFEQSILLNWLSVMYPFSAYNGSEYPYTQSLFLIIIALFGAGLVYVFSSISALAGKERLKKLFSEPSVLFIMAILLIFLYFKMADETNFGGIVSPRLLFLSAIFAVLWVSVIRIPAQLFAFIIPLTLYFTWSVLVDRRTYGDHVSEVASEVIQVADQVKPYSTVVPFNYDDRWLCGHIYDYLGTEKPMIILQNYEASTGYFPLRWNFAAMNDIMIGNMRDSEIADGKTWVTNHESPKKEQADYVFLVGNDYKEHPDAFSRALLQNLESHYKLIYKGKFTRLFINNAKIKPGDNYNFPKEDLADVLHGNKYTLQLASDSNRYIGLNPADFELANSSSPVEVEITGFEGNKVALRFANGKFLCSDLNQNGNLIADRDSPGAWETFTLEQRTNGSYALKTFKGKYLSISQNAFSVSDTFTAGSDFLLLPVSSVNQPDSLKQ